MRSVVSWGTERHSVCSETEDFLFFPGSIGSVIGEKSRKNTEEIGLTL